MSGADFTQKKIKFTVSLGEGTFGDTVSDTVELEGFRAMAELKNPGGETMGMVQAKIWGLSPALINQLTSIGTINKSVRLRNSIFVDAGDDESGLMNIFQGTIFDAWADYNSAPDIGFNIIAYSGLSAALRPVNPTSYNGATDVAEIMQVLATEAQLEFVDYGVQKSLQSPYLQGTTLSKIRAVARAAEIFHIVDKGKLIISPKDKGVGGEKPQVSKETGMVGYPTLSSKGMSIKHAFRGDIEVWQDVAVTSSVQMACGTWRIINLSHSLSCELPDGPWFTTLELGYAQ
jgi:hypothetical protein